MENLNRKRGAILATNGFEESELRDPKEKEALEKAGAEVHIISDQSGDIKSWSDGGGAISTRLTKTLDQVNHGDYHALVLPGGLINPDILRNDKAIEFVRSFFRNHKPVGAICHTCGY
ncbi:MAG: DJ-1/PfpI family protein [Chitinophagales bacterium]